MAEYKIVQEHEKCIACQACVMACDNWVIGSDGKAKPKNVKVSTKAEVECNRKAEKACPISIIHVKKVTGK